MLKAPRSRLDDKLLGLPSLADQMALSERTLGLLDANPGGPSATPAPLKGFLFTKASSFASRMPSCLLSRSSRPSSCPVICSSPRGVCGCGGCNCSASPWTGT